jgi:uncharacterized membrane protein YgdD (TMEM256/DUF423 family)
MKKWIIVSGILGFLAVALGAGGVCGDEEQDIDLTP